MLNLFDKIRDTYQNESGAALIVVLSFLVLVGMIISSAVMISQINARSFKIVSDRSYAGYLAEGAAARLQWLVMNDRNTNKNSSSLSNLDNTNEEIRYSADGRIINMDYDDSKISGQIFDMHSGIDISGSNPTKKLKELQVLYQDDPDKNQEYKTFLDILSDYVDRNSLTHLNGMEKDDYLALDLPPLPRNSKLEYREEILLLPESQNFFLPDKNGRLSEFNIIPPKGMPAFKKGKDNFFSVDKTILMSKLRIDSEEADDMINSRNKWSKSSEAITDFIDPEMMSKLKSSFSFKDSGYYTLIIKASPGDGMASRTLLVSLKIDNKINTSGNQYYQYVIY